MKIKKVKLPQLPTLLNRKIYKTGQTRGADDDVIYQNRVGRNSTVLIPYLMWDKSFPYPNHRKEFENGFIVLIPPSDFFESKDISSELKQKKLSLGVNCLVFYETRQDWNKYNPDKLNWSPAQKRTPPLKGNYVARVPATTALKGGGKIIHGFTTTSGKGAGIRLYEYASTETNNQCRLQLEATYWLCTDSVKVAASSGMTYEDADYRKKEILELCDKNGLLDYSKLTNARIINSSKKTICPLCLKELSGSGFFNRMAQAEGREVPDLTITEINLFHINELRYGVYNHSPYNLGWGHHHCNIVTKDSGIIATLEWMDSVLKRNRESGFEI